MQNTPSAMAEFLLATLLTKGSYSPRVAKPPAGSSVLLASASFLQRIHSGRMNSDRITTSLRERRCRQRLPSNPVAPAHPQNPIPPSRPNLCSTHGLLTTNRPLQAMATHSRKSSGSRLSISSHKPLSIWQAFQFKFFLSSFRQMNRLCY